MKLRTDVLWGASLGALVVLATLGPKPKGYWAPDGFVARANRIIAEGGLELRCGVQDQVVPNLTVGTADERFFRSSYLRADVRRFNDDPTAPRSPFLVEGCELLGVDPFYHRIDLPYNRSPRWTGTLRFQEAELSAALVGGKGQRLEVLHPGTGPGRGGALRVDPRSPNRSARSEFLRVERSGSREIAADFFFVGDGPVMADRRDVDSPLKLRLDGYQLPPGRLVRIETGDWVQLEDRDGPITYIVRGADQAELISTAGKSERGGDRRVFQPRLAPFVTSLSQALEAGLQSTPSAQDGGLGSGFDLRLTLDRELEMGAQDVVASWCGERNLATRPRGVSALIMDAFSGDVKAMPSCPGPAEMEEFAQLPARLRSRYLRNQNLISHPVGSAAKPFWAAAVATAYPGLLDLEIPVHQERQADEVFGCTLAASYATATHEAWEGLESFIQTSCNRYLVEMATAALLASEGSPSCGEDDVATCFRDRGEGLGTPVRLCDQVVNLVLEEGLPFTGDRCGDLRLVDADFKPGPAFEGLTGVAAYRDRAPLGSAGVGLDEAYRAGRYRLDVWRGPMAALQAAGDTADPTITALRFAAVSPQVTNLALNTVEELRTDWINLLLGGENSRWTNFQLAESVARLMTGRDVRGQLVAEAGDLDPGEAGPWDIGDRPEPEPLSVESLHPGARRRVLHAMERVIGPGGTGVRLGSAVRELRDRVRAVLGAERHEVYAFAKTGTPAVSVPVALGVEDREGSVLVLGLLIVPPESGRSRSAEVEDWVSACPVRPELKAGILGVPPVSMLDSEQSIGVTVAVYLDDLDGEGDDGSATGLALDLMGPLANHLTTSLELQLRR